MTYKIINSNLKYLLIMLAAIVSVSTGSLAWSAESNKSVLGDKEGIDVGIKKGKSPDRKEGGREEKRDDKGVGKMKKKVVMGAGAAAMTGVASKRVMSNIKGD